MSYDVKNGQVVGGKGVRVPPFELAEKFVKQIPQGCAIEDVMHALNMLMAEAVARRGQNIEERKRIADAFHVGLLRSLELNALVEKRILDIRNRLRAEGKEINEEEFKNLVAAEMKQAAEDLRRETLNGAIAGGGGPLNDGSAGARGRVFNEGVSETAKPQDVTGAPPKDVLQ